MSSFGPAADDEDEGKREKAPAERRRLADLERHLPRGSATLLAMAAYVVVDIHVQDPVRYEEYRCQAAPSVTAFGGRYLVRGGAVTKLEGDWTPARFVVLEFPSAARAKEWWNSDLYRPIKAIRHATARTSMVLVEGC